MIVQDDIKRIALAQSAIDLNAEPNDFLKSENVITRHYLNAKTRVYYSEPIAATLVSYGNNIVASTKDEYRDIIKEYIEKFDFNYCFQTPNICWLDKRLENFGQKVCFQAEYFLPNLEKTKVIPCNYETRILEREDFASLYLKEWSNALCAYRKEKDVLAVGAYDNGKLIALAGCSADCTEMWQIGVDVLPEYRGQGIGKAITSILTSEILKRDKVPFYCCAWSNIKSMKNALSCGYTPAWVEITIKPIEKFNDYLS